MDSRESRRSAVCERRTERLMADLDRQHLQRAFRLFNKTLFDGELPRYRVVVEQPHNVLENRCIPSGCVGGLCDRTARTIFIALMASGDQEDTLKHEMIHVRVGGGHGEAFRDELRRLIERGDQWAIRHLASIQPTDDNIREKLQIFIRAGHSNWPEARDHVAAALGLSPRELRRLAPWARQFFRDSHCDPENL